MIIFEGVFGKGKCGCPCRSYWVPKCEIVHVQQCHYDHYQNQVGIFIQISVQYDIMYSENIVQSEILLTLSYTPQVCHTVPVPQVRQAKETECQRCRKYTVPTPATKWAIECNPVYDEKCKTRLV